MSGVFTNPIAIVVGACVGIFFKKYFSEEIAKRCELALGFSSIIIGIKMALQFQSVLLVVLCLCVGGILGTALQVERNTEKFLAGVQARFVRGGDGKFALGLSTASILYCTGAMAIVGAINSGVAGNNELLFTKSLVDGILSITFASLYGMGVAFAAIPVFLYQGSIAVLASRLEVLSQPSVLAEISGVGGVLLTMIGINMSGIKKISVGDFLPALPLVMIGAALMTLK